jgi:hypothetical protein
MPILTFWQLVKGLVFFNMLDDGGHPNFSGLSVTFQHGKLKISWDGSTHSTRLSRWGKTLTMWADIGLYWANEKGFLSPEESESLFPKDNDCDEDNDCDLENTIPLWRIEFPMEGYQE